VRRSLVILLLASCAAWAQSSDQARTSTDLLFAGSNSAAALQESKSELRRNGSDVAALFAEMEAARLQLHTGEEMQSALLLLEKVHVDDPRTQLAAGRIQELAANTSVFRRAIPQLCALLRENSRYSRQITSALLTAHADGVALPRGARLLRRINKWRIAGPFGEFSNVDFDRSWPPERDQLASPAYGKLVREQVSSSSGELELPNYFPQSGIYYAESTFRTANEQKYTITIEGDGTYELQLDGKRLLLHDSRFQSQTKISQIETSISAGTHRILLKLQPEAFPIRVWLQHGTIASLESVRLGKAESYVKAANALLDGDLGSALAFGDDSSSIELTLRAEAQAQLQQSTKARDSLLKASAVDSTNSLAKLQIARQAIAEERFEEAANYLAKVLDVAPSYWPAQELKYKMAVQFDWKQERSAALKQLLHLHPGCSPYSELAKRHRYDSNLAFYESKLALCSPRPGDYWSELSERGDHGRALLSLERYIQAHTNDRRALEIAVREAVLSENEGAARKYAAALRRVAPNWERAAGIAENPDSILDSPSAYTFAEEFYRPFSREAAPLLVQNVANADSKVLINDRVIKLEKSGSAWVYQHNLVQVFDKKGIDAAGEVDIPRGADLIELRTIKRDGSSVRPELAGRKSTVSMPSLAQGDAVELAYVQHFRAADLQATPELLDFFFASAEAPTDSSRLTIIRESSDEPRLWFSRGVEQIESRAEGNEQVSTWEARNLPAVVAEPHAPQFETRARMLSLRLDASGEPALATRYRDQLIAATQIDPVVEQTAANVRATNPRDAIAMAYQLVESSVEEDGESWENGKITSGSDSLAQGEGNRAATLIALLSAMGFDADLELAAERGRTGVNDDCPTFRCYTHPLVRVILPNAKRPIILDPQAKGIAAGALSPAVEGENALVIRRSRAGEAEIATVPQGTDQKTRAVANLVLDDDGTIRGTVRIHFGSFRGAQMRDTLHDLSAKDRQSYFEEIGSRIFPRASKISVSIFHEDEPEKPLEVEFTVATSGASRWNGSSLDLGQLIPALGLSRLYATLPVRNQDLWLETPLIEESEFTVHLPAGVEVWHMPEPFTVKSSFGEYRTDFRLENGALKIVRSFRIPMQQIAAAQYPEFSKFALQIDSAEREQLQLRRVSVAQERSSSLRSLR